MRITYGTGEFFTCRARVHTTVFPSLESRLLRSTNTMQWSDYNISNGFLWFLHRARRFREDFTGADRRYRTDWLYWRAYFDCFSLRRCRPVIIRKSDFVVTYELLSLCPRVLSQPLCRCCCCRRRCTVMEARCRKRMFMSHRSPDNSLSPLPHSPAPPTRFLANAVGPRVTMIYVDSHRFRRIQDSVSEFVFQEKEENRKFFGLNWVICLNAISGIHSDIRNGPHTTKFFSWMSAM